MKKTFLVLLLIPTLAHSQTPSGTTIVSVTTGAPTSTTSTTAVTLPVSTPVVATTDTKITTPVATTVTVPVKVQPTLKVVTSGDMTDAKISLGLTATQIVVSGSIPKVCADRLSLSNVETFAEVKSSEDSDIASLDKKEDLKDYAKTVSAQITFSGDEKTPFLHDCIVNAAADSEMADLSKDPHFARTVFTHSELAVAGLVGETSTAKSPEYIKMEKQIDNLLCTTCNADPKKMKAHLAEARGVNSPLLILLMTKVYESALADMAKKIDAATSIRDLETIRAQLIEMGDFSTSDDDRGAQLALFDKLTAKNDTLAHDGNHKTASVASHHLDFDRDTYSKAAALTGLSADKSDELKSLATDLAPGQQKRLEFLSSVDGDHPEVHEYLQKSDQEQQILQAQINRTCPAQMNQPMNMQMNMRMNQYNQNNQFMFTRCNELKNTLATKQASVATMQSAYTQADAQNVNGIYSFWTSRNVSFTPNIFSTSGSPTQANALQTMPQMYDPRNPPTQFANFNANQLYQFGGAQQGMNNGFNNQGNSYRPMSYRP